MATNPKKRKHGEVESKFYAVRAGKTPGVYTTWTDCQANTVGFKGANYKSFPTWQDAQDYVNGKAVKNTADKAKPAKFYGVAVGHVPGVYEEWADAQRQVTDIKGPKYKKFETRAEAEEFVRSGGKVPKEGAAATPRKEKLDKTVRQAGQNSLSIGMNDTRVLAQERPPAKKPKTSASSSSRKRKVVVYTDGSSRGNGKVGALAGVGVYFGEGDERNVSEPLQGMPQTNQRAELTAVLRALQIVPSNQAMEIVTDSNYSINCATEWYKKWMKNDWKVSTGGAVLNKDLVIEIRKLLDTRELNNVETVFTWIKGHSEDPGNEGADRLAVAGAMGAR